jgi:hypothetical protein
MTAKEFGHVSTFSPKRVINMAKSCGLNLNFLSGTFLLRKRNFPLENHAAWIRLNLLWGALLPSLSGEIYWQMNRPGNSGNSVV